jgi:DNA-binding NarL/FixJ family response regulator
MNSETQEKFRVVLVEDHPMFRDQLGQLINKEPGMQVCGEADNISDAFNLIESQEPDIAIVDLTLKGPSGLELIKNLKAKESDVPVLVLSMHDETLYAERVLKAGARGEIYLPAQISSRILESVAIGRKTQNGVAQLTDRELEVFELIGHGRTTREISNCLHLGMSTVDTYRARIKTKLHLENSGQLYHEAIRWVSEGEAGSV